MVHKVKLNPDENLKSVYASRYMSIPVSKNHMPEESLPQEFVYELISEYLDLDSNPSQNLASFVSTRMEKEADELLKKALSFNLADEDEYPHIIKIQERCVSMLGNLLHAEQDAIGVSSVGSSEAIMLAGLAMKWQWRQRRQQEGKDTTRPNIIMGENVQVVWEKFARYFDVDVKYIPVTHDRFIINAEEVIKRVDENTIGVCVILGSTFTGEFEPVEAICNALDKLEKETGLNVPVHVDAASGGFVAPFLYPELKWDFQLKRVVSINLSGHKYGLVYPGVGWVLWRNKASLPDELIFKVNYLGGEMPTFTLNFSRSSAFIIGQYYNFLRLGKAGYRAIMHNLKTVSDNLSSAIAEIDCFEVISATNALPLVAWKVLPGYGFNAFDLSDKLRQFGWVVPAYTMPKDAEDLAILRVVVRNHFSEELAEEFLEDLKNAVVELRTTTTPHKQKAAIKRKKPKKIPHEIC